MAESITGLWTGPAAAPTLRELTEEVPVSTARMFPGQLPADRPVLVPEPLLRDVIGQILRDERTAQDRTLRDVADVAGISMPYLSEVERGRKEASSEILAAVAGALGLRLLDVVGRAQWELARTAPSALTSTRAPVTTSRPSYGSASVTLRAA